MQSVYEIIKQHTGNGCEIEKTIAINRLIYARTYNLKQSYKYYKKYPDWGLENLIKDRDLLKEALSEFPDYNKMPSYIESQQLLDTIQRKSSLSS